jgi:hypothetical protein
VEWGGVAGRCRVLQGVAGCCRVLQGVAGCCRVLQGVGMGVFADVSVFVYHICANAYMYYVHMRTYTCMVYMNV